MSGGKQETTSKTEYDPAYMARINQNYDRAKSIADAPFQAYSGERVAGFNPTQVQAQGILGGIATDPSYRANNQTAIGAVNGVLGGSYNPTITPRAVTASTYDPAQLAGTDLSPYLSPYTDQVVNSTLADLSHARDMQGVKDNAAATAAHAFGGSRQGVQAAQTTDDYLRNVAGTSANLRASAFGNAQQAALSDVASRNAAGAFNAGQRQQAGIFNSGQDFNAQQNGFDNALRAAGLKMDAAGRLSALNANDFALATQQGGILAGVGADQQALQQAQDDAAYEEFMRMLQDPYQKQALLSQALGAFPVQATTTNTTKTKGDLFGGILGAIAGGAKIGSQFYGSGG